LDPLDTSRSSWDRLRACDVEHALVEIQPGDVALRPDAFGGKSGDHTGAAGDVQYTFAGSKLRQGDKIRRPWSENDRNQNALIPLRRVP
jgi:hypothetical protein